jgi:crotonobetainyl-CoA:carnitine CoA-transferase CaiB-like acyl-CoA transferase
MFGTLISLQPWEIIQTSITGKENRRAGRGTQFLHGVWGAFRASDGWIAIAGVDEERWEKFCELIERPDLVNDPECNNESRNFRGDKIQRILDELIPKRTRAQWMERFGPNDVFATPVATYLDILDNEQARVNGYIRELDHPQIGKVRMSGNPIRMSESPMREFAPAPELGADTESVLHELGYSADEVAAFRANEVI